MLLLALGLGLMAPHGASAKGSTVVYANYVDMRDWDPASAFSTESLVLHNLYETLVRYVPDAQTGAARIEPVLATDWSVSENGLIWTFNLRSDVTFHDGEPLTAQAVKASLDRTMAKGEGGAYIWYGVKEIRAVDPLTVEIETFGPMPIDLIATAQYASFIYSLKSIAAGDAWFDAGNAAGTGPYYLRRWRKGVDVVLDKYEAYWGGWSEGQFRRAIIKVVHEPATQSLLIRTGDADFISSVPIDIVRSLSRRDEIEVAFAPSWYNKQFLINTQKFPTNDRFFRQALVHAFDYDGVLNGVYLGGGKISKGAIPGTMWGHDGDLETPQFDLEKARAFLAQTAVPPELWKIRVTYVASDTAYRNALLDYQKNLSEIGIELELDPGEWGKIWSEARALPSAPNIISMTWWPTYPTPGDWLKGLFYTEEAALFNLSYYDNSAYNALVDQGFTLTGVNRDEATEKFQAAQRLLIEDAVAVFYADINSRIIHRADVEVPAPNPAYATVFFYESRRTATAQE